MPRLTLHLFVFILFLTSCSTLPTRPNSQNFNLVEATIPGALTALKKGITNCEKMTNGYLARIKKYDQNTRLNAIILINPNATNRAKKLDTEYLKTGKLRKLHCIPVILKDNFDTSDMPTEAGSIALKGSVPPDDAFMVKKLRDAGAIIIAKSNMGEWAFSPHQTISSTHGETLNAYDLDRVPAGSSGGTASAIAASFGIIGMGTDTGNSIRGPASHLSLVGMRSTIGATSRDGIVPLVLNRDIAGPLTRTVTDNALTYSVIAGYDPADPVTEAAKNKTKKDYSAYLNPNGLKGARLGVLRALVDTDMADFEINNLFEESLKDLKSAGATIVDPFAVEHFDKLRKATGFCSRFRYDLNNYLTSLGENAPVKSLEDIVKNKSYGNYSKEAMKWAMSVNVKPQQQKLPCVDVQGDPRRKQFLDAMLAAMNKYKVDAIIYPSWSNPPRQLGDSVSPHGNNSPVIAPHTGQPAITVPMGFTSDGLPAGLQLLGRYFDEGKLFQYAYAYEQATKHRRAPKLFKAIE